MLASVSSSIEGKTNRFPTNFSHFGVSPDQRSNSIPTQKKNLIKLSKFRNKNERIFSKNTYPNLVRCQFGYCQNFGTSIAAEAYDGGADADDVAIESLNRASQSMNKRNIHCTVCRLIGLIAVYDSDSLRSIAVRMCAVAEENGNLAKCHVYVGAPMKMPLPS